MWPPLVAVGLAAAGPDQGVGLGVLVVEEVGVNRSVKARIVEFDREIIASLAEALGPDGSDLGNTEIDPVARRVVVGALCLGDDADALGLQAQGDDFAVEFLAGFLERADDSHVTSPYWFRAPRPPRPLDGDLRAEGDRRRTRSGWSAVEDGGGGDFLDLREERAKPRGRKSHRRRCRFRRSRPNRPSAR